MKENYGYKLFACGISIFWCGTIAFGYAGVVGLHWQEMFQVGSTETGLVVTFMLLALACCMFFSGKVHQMIGMAKCLIIAWVMFIIAFTILYFAKNMIMVYIWGFMSNTALSFVYGPGLATVQQAAPHKRGLVSGILNMIFGISAAIMSPIMNNVLINKGYQFLNLMLVILITVTFIIAYLVLTIGDKMAANEDHAVSGQTATKHVTHNVDMTVGQALKSKAFWLIWLTWVFMGAAGISMTSLAKLYAVEINLSAVSLLTAFGMANGISRIFVGILSDKIEARYLSCIAFVLAGVGYIYLPHAGSLTVMSACAIAVGIGFGTLFTITGPLASGLFGLKNFGMIFGLIFTAYGFIGGLAGPAISGILLEKTGANYTIVFTYLGILALIASVLMAFVRNAEK